MEFWSIMRYFPPDQGKIVQLCNDFPNSPIFLSVIRTSLPMSFPNMQNLKKISDFRLFFFKAQFVFYKRSLLLRGVFFFFSDSPHHCFHASISYVIFWLKTLREEWVGGSYVVLLLPSPGNLSHSSSSQVFIASAVTSRIKHQYSVYGNKHNVDRCMFCLRK